jgi:hypothetical protein
MPPRRATRAASSTPTRALPHGAQINNLTPARSTALEGTPLPDLEAEQSFAYGASNTKPLPQKLIARKKMTIKQMAETLDAGIVQAGRNFQAQREEAEQYGLNVTDARAARAAKRSSTRDSREGSEVSEHTPAPSRPANRANGMSAAQTHRWLQDIQEEADSRNEQVASDAAGSASSIRSHESLSDRSLSPPPTRIEESSMPDVHRFDQTYSHERNLHVQGSLQPPEDIWTRLERMRTRLRHFLIDTRDRLRQIVATTKWNQIFSQGRQIGVTVALASLAIIVSLLLCRTACDWYCETQWASELSRPWQDRVNQQICRFSTSGYHLPPSDTSGPEVSRLIRKFKQQESLVQEMQTKQSLTSATIDQLTGLQSELLKQQSDLERRLAEAKASKKASSASSLSPVFSRINYAAPGVGAVIDPHLTSPTKTKHFPFYQRLLLGTAALQKYQSRPPLEALQPWSEIGDCWCAAATRRPDEPANTEIDSKTSDQTGRYTQLAILLGYPIFPDEIVIEHLPLSNTPSPGSAPRDIQVWADISHLRPDQLTPTQQTHLQQQKQQQLQKDSHHQQHHQSPPTLIHLGSFHYSAPSNTQGSTAQVFPLDANTINNNNINNNNINNKNNNNNNDQTTLIWSTSKLLVRITSNWGAANTCLYRVRVHGLPVRGHQQIVDEA